MLKTQIIYTIGFLLFSHSICLKFTKCSPNFTVSTKLGRDTSVIILRSPSTSKLLLLTSLYQSLNIIIYKMFKKICTKGICYWGNNFCSIKVSLESSILHLFHNVSLRTLNRTHSQMQTCVFKNTSCPMYRFTGKSICIYQ